MRKFVIRVKKGKIYSGKSQFEVSNSSGGTLCDTAGLKLQ